MGTLRGIFKRRGGNRLKVHISHERTYLDVVMERERGIKEMLGQGDINVLDTLVRERRFDEVQG